MSTLIRGGTVVNHDHSQRADVLIDGGKIVAIGAEARGAGGRRDRSMRAAATSCRAASIRTPTWN